MVTVGSGVLVAGGPSFAMVPVSESPSWSAKGAARVPVRTAGPGDARGFVPSEWRVKVSVFWGTTPRMEVKKSVVSPLAAERRRRSATPWKTRSVLGVAELLVMREMKLRRPPLSKKARTACPR
jgi:hypothetical protein